MATGRLPRWFPLRVSADPRRMIVRVPPSRFVLTGVLMTVVSPICFGVLCVLVRLSGTSIANGEPWSFAFVGAITLAFVVVGVWHLKRARQWSHETEVVFDRAHGVLRRATDEGGVPMQQAAAVRLRDRKLRSGVWAIDVVAADGTTMMVVYGLLPASHHASSTRVVEAMNGWLRDGTPVPAELGEGR